MAFSRQLAVVSILSACFFVSVACSDDEDKKTTEGDAGEGGEGNASSGGSSGGTKSPTAGTGGSAGSAMAGQGGAAAGEGGTGGRDGAGAAGEAGSALGGGAGAGGAGAGGAGAGGDAGGGGAAGAPSALTQCAASCEQNSDCSIDGDETLKCDEVTKQCFDPTERCAVVDDCMPVIGQWIGCPNNAFCQGLGDFSCIEWQGAGYCAPQASVDFGCGGDTVTSLPAFGGTGTLTVCVPAHARCTAGECVFSCTSPVFGCQAGSGTCNEVTGLCECDEDSDCSNGVCGPDSLCAECVTSADCAGNLDGNLACIDGKCGCSSVDACPNYGWSQATPVCQ